MERSKLIIVFCYFGVKYANGETCSSPSGAKVPSGFTLGPAGGDKYYKLESAAVLTYWEAKTKCWESGARVATIKTQQEYQDVRGLLGSSGSAFVALLNPTGRECNAQTECQASEYVWDDDEQTPFAALSFLSSTGLSNTQGLLCMQLKQDGQLDGANCNDPHQTVCQFNCPTGHEAGPCPSAPDDVTPVAPFTPFKGSYYLFVDVPTGATGAAAKQACQAVGSHLIVIRDESDFDTVVFLKDAYDRAVWIGLGRKSGSRRCDGASDCLDSLSWEDGTEFEAHSFFDRVISDGLRTGGNVCFRLIDGVTGSGNINDKGCNDRDLYNYICEFRCPVVCSDPPDESANLERDWDGTTQVEGETVT